MFPEHSGGRIEEAKNWESTRVLFCRACAVHTLLTHSSRSLAIFALSLSFHFRCSLLTLFFPLLFLSLLLTQYTAFSLQRRTFSFRQNGKKQQRRRQARERAKPNEKYCQYASVMLEHLNINPSCQLHEIGICTLLSLSSSPRHGSRKKVFSMQKKQHNGGGIRGAHWAELDCLHTYYISCVVREEMWSAQERTVGDATDSRQPTTTMTTSSSGSWCAHTHAIRCSTWQENERALDSIYIDGSAWT